MSRPYINNYLNTLNQQIADTAARIKQKQQAENTSGSPSFAAEKEALIGSLVEIQAYKLMDNDVSYTLLGQNAPTDSFYAADTYSYISKVDKKPTIAEGLVFKNNQEFDFKV